MRAQKRREGPHEAYRREELAVPCEHARPGRPHMVTIVTAGDGTVMHIGSTCRKDKANDAIRRLGGSLCYRPRWALQQMLRGKKVTRTHGIEQFGDTVWWQTLSTRVDELYRGVNWIRNGRSTDRRQIQEAHLGGPRELHTVIQASEIELRGPGYKKLTPRGRWRHLLLEAWVSKHAGLTCYIRISPTEAVVARGTRTLMAQTRWAGSGFELARETRPGWWVIDEIGLLNKDNTGMPVGEKCRVCKLNIESRGNAAHINGRKHRENTVKLAREAVKFLNRVGAGLR